MAHSNSNHNLNEQFIVPAKQKTIAFVLMAIGIIALAIGFFIHKENPERIWANLLLDSVFFLGLIMSSAFFVAAHYVAWGGWWIVIRRIPEAISSVLPVAAGILGLVLVLGNHHLYEWTHAETVSADAILQSKAAYLNLPFFFIRFAFFLGILITLNWLMRRSSQNEDLIGGLTEHKANLKWASLFLLFFAVYISVSAWDWLMSLDPHWFSTMFAWYAFASFWVSGISVITLVVVYLKRNGYLSYVTENHLHDLGKYMFAFTVFWTYVTYDQFMLIWYANIPEETIYFKERFMNYEFLFFAVWILNFIVPFFSLIRRDEKRKMKSLTIVAIIIIFGHFLDYYLMVMPATVKENHGFGILEIGLPCFYIGLFIYLVFSYMSKRPLVAKNSPYLKESLNHHI